MTQESFYEWTDHGGKKRIVRSIRGRGTFRFIDGVGSVVTDVEDIKTGEQFTAVPYAGLEFIPPP